MVNGVVTSMDALHAYLDVEPGDRVTRLALADLLDETGDYGGSVLQQWLVSEGKWPHHDEDGWAWFCWIEDYGEHCRLPSDVWRRLPGPHNHPTRRQAEDDLRYVMETLWPPLTTS